MSGHVNDLCKLLDNGYTVSIFRNGIGSYTVVAYHDESFFEDFAEGLGESHITDDFTPDKAFYRLAEKVTTGRIV